MSRRHISSRITTTDATSSVAAILSFQVDGCIAVTGVITAINPAGTAVAYFPRVCFQRVATVITMLVGQAIQTVPVDNAAQITNGFNPVGLDGDFVGDRINLRVIGIAATVIRWEIEVDVDTNPPPVL
jgi:hypothetical protein